MQEGSSARKRGSKFSDKDVISAKTSMRDSGSPIEGLSSFDQNISQADKNTQSTDCIDDIKQIFMDKHVSALFPAYSFLLPSLSKNFYSAFSIIFEFIELQCTEKCEQELAYTFIFPK